MNKVFFTLCCLINLYTVTLTAQWQRQYPLPKLEEVLDMVVREDGYGFAVGSDDLALRYNSATKTWHLLPDTEFGWSLFTVDYLEGTNGMYVAAGGTALLVSVNGGLTWEKITGAPSGIQKLKILDEGSIIVIAGNGVHLWENDIWTSLGAPVASGLFGGFILDATHIWAYTGGTDPVIYYTANGGNVWESNNEIERPDAVIFYNAQYGVALDNRHVFQTTNGGDNWIEVSTNAIHNSISDITFGETANIMMAATLNGDPALTVDSGRTWTQIEMDLLNQRSYSVFYLGDEYWVGNDQSSIGYAPDNVLSWSEVSGPRRKPFYDMHFLSRSIGFGVGFDGALVRTINGGAQWEDVSFETDRTYWSIHGTSTANLWLGASQRIYFSNDTGATWTVSGTFLGGNFNDILAISDTRILAATSAGNIYRSDDSGMTWDTMYQTNTQIRSLAKIDDQHYMATGFNGIILRSDDQGETWTTLTPPEAGLQYEQSFFLDDDGWLITSSFESTMWHTTNAGDSWDPITLPIDRAWNGVYFITQDTGIVVASSSAEGRAYITYNGGMTWQTGYVTDYQLLGVTGVHNPNGTAWIFGTAADIEVLPYCNTLPTIANLQGNFSPCENDTLTYTIVGEQVDEYYWFFPADWQVIGNADNDTVRVRAGDQSGIISVTGVNACGFTPALTAGVSPVELPDVGLIAGEGLPCEASLEMYAASATDVDNFTWTFPGADWVLVGNPNSHEVQVIVGTTAGDIQVTGTNQCGSDDAVKVNVIPLLLPVAFTVEGDFTPCAGSQQEYIFTGQFVDQVGWSLPLDWVIIDQPEFNTIIVQVGNVGSGILLATAGNDCGISQTLEYTITIEEGPDVTVFALNGTNTLVAEYIGIPVYIQWYLNGEVIPDGTTSQYEATVSGNYYVEVTTENGCVGTSPVYNHMLVALADVYDDPAIAIVPNPAHDALRLTGLAKETPFEIVNMHGQSCERGIVFNAPVAIDHLASGVYLVKLHMGERVVVKRIVVLKS